MEPIHGCTHEEHSDFIRKMNHDARLAAPRKVSAKTIQRILKHQKQATTERYIQKINTDLRETLNLLGEKGHQERLSNNIKGVKNALNPLRSVAGATRLELATSGVTRRLTPH
jgi:hypothetical protein